jgi:hypothetical protein
LQSAALPVNVSVVHALLSLQLVGQLPSHVSGLSTTPSPQQGCIAVCVHLAVQAAALPVIVSVVHLLPSSQLVGQVLGGSHCSPASMTPLPQQGTIGVNVHLAEQAAAVPERTSVVHTLLSLQLAGQAPVPEVIALSQFSPASTMPLPQQGVIVVTTHLAVQAVPESVEVWQASAAVQLVGQAPAPEVIAVSQFSPESTVPLPQQGTIGVSTHLAVQAVPVSAEVWQASGAVQLVGQAPG